MRENKRFSIKELADLAKVSTRTLRFYDERGLLKPAEIGSNGYRYYDQNNLLRLQQILFFRELDLPIKEIHRILSHPDFNIHEVLNNHRGLLENKASRLAKLIDTLDQTILNLEGEWEMVDKDYFEGFDEAQHEEEAKERWGDSTRYTESQKKWGNFTEKQKEEIKAEGAMITLAMVGKNPLAQPDDPTVQAAINEYHNYLNKYFYSCDVAFLRNLADMWLQDERFAINYDRIREGGAAFVHKAVHLFCDRNSEN